MDECSERGGVVQRRLQHRKPSATKGRGAAQKRRLFLLRKLTCEPVDAAREQRLAPHHCGAFHSCRTLPS